MPWIILFSVFIAAILWFYLYVLHMLYTLENKNPVKDTEEQNLPFISVLVAARNEEKNLASCLESLIAQNYPPDKIEILVGSDASSDSTLAIAQSYGAKFSHLVTWDISSDSMPHTKGKARVLAFLAQKAKGEFLLVTDADCIVTPSWAKTLVQAFESNIAIVTGFTELSFTRNLFQLMQKLDWLLFMGINNILSNTFFSSATTIGNNMAIRSTAYWQTGGYEKIPFSLTEDFKLYVEVKKIGWQTRNLISADAKVQSYAQDSWGSLLSQRQRWVRGARKEFPSKWKPILFLLASTYLLFGTLLFINPKVALLFWALRFFLQFLTLQAITTKISSPPLSLFHLVLYEFFSFTLLFLSFILMLLPIQVKWKGRKFEGSASK